MKNLLKPNTKDTTELIRWAYQFKTKKEYMERHRQDQIFRYNKNRYFTDVQLRDPDHLLKIKSIDEMNQEFDQVVQSYQLSGKITSFNLNPIDRRLSVVDQALGITQNVLNDSSEFIKSLSIDQISGKDSHSSLQINQDFTSNQDLTQELEISRDNQQRQEITKATQNYLKKSETLEEADLGQCKNQKDLFYKKIITGEEKGNINKSEHLEISENSERDQESIGNILAEKKTNDYPEDSVC